MRIYDFTLVLSAGIELTEELSEALFVAGCDDGSPGSCEGVVTIDFHREAETLEAAIRSAIADVRKPVVRLPRPRSRPTPRRFTVL